MDSLIGRDVEMNVQALHPVEADCTNNGGGGIPSVAGEKLKRMKFPSKRELKDKKK